MANEDKSAGYVKVSAKEREIEHKAKEAAALANPLFDEKDIHVQINNAIAAKYPLNSQNALFRHAIKELLDKAGIVDTEFDTFNSDCDAIVADIKAKQKRGN